MTEIGFEALVTGIGGQQGSVSGIEFENPAGSYFFALPRGDCMSLGGFMYKRVNVTLRIEEIPEEEDPG